MKSPCEHPAHKVKIGTTGKTLAVKGVWYCNGLTLKNKPQEFSK